MLQEAFTEIQNRVYIFTRELDGCRARETRLALSACEIKLLSLVAAAEQTHNEGARSHYL